MLEKGKITYRQLIQIMFISRVIIFITYFPAINSPPENQDIWLSEVLSYPIILLFSIPVYLLWKKFPNQTIIQYSQTILGRAGKIIGIVYVWFFMHLCALTLCQFCGFLTTAIMPETPLLFFAISLVLFTAYAVRKGIEVMGRMSEIIAPVIIIAALTIVVFLIKDMKLENLTPVMESGFFPVLHGAFTTSSRTFKYNFHIAIDYAYRVLE